MNRILSPIIFATLFLLAQLATAQYSVGDQVENFSLKNIDGKMVTLDDYADAEGVILVFTCNTCPYAKFYEQRIIELTNTYASKNFPVIAINANDPEIAPGDSYTEMQARAKEKGYPFPYLYDETQEIAKAYGATRTPEIYLLEKKEATYTLVYTGAIDDNPRDASNVKTNYVDSAIEALKSGKSISQTKTKAIGCTIKWRKS